MTERLSYSDRKSALISKRTFNMNFYTHKLMAWMLVLASNTLASQHLLADDNEYNLRNDVGLARLDEGAKRIAVKVAKVLRDRNEVAINVGDFTAPPRLKASGGAGVRHAVITALKQANIDTRDDARLQLAGAFSDSDPEKPESPVALYVNAKLLDERDREIHLFSIAVLGVAGLQMAGGTAELPANLPEIKRLEIQKDRLYKPQAAVRGNESRADAESPYGVEVRVSNSYDATPRTPTTVAGRPFVALRKGEKYIIRLHNRSQYDAAVLLTIDGLSTFAFSKEGNFGGQFVVPPGRFVDVTGWYFAMNDARSFVLTSYPESAAGQKGLPVSSIGVITATFSAAWQPDQLPPPDEASRPVGPGTGIGEPSGQQFKPIVRRIGAPRSVVSVRYNRE